MLRIRPGFIKNFFFHNYRDIMKPRTNRYTFKIVILIVCWVAFCSTRSQAVGSHTNNTNLFNKSDVIAFVPGTKEDYHTYHVDFVSWGGYPLNDRDSRIGYDAKIKAAQSVGVKFGAKIGTRTDFKGFIEFASKDELIASRCVDVNGKPLLVPAAEKETYKNYPAYWFCTNSPKFREYLKANVQRAMLFKPQGILVDDPLGTAQAANWGGGCYCKYCVEGFRNYLKKRYSNEQLEKMGISDINSFDLKAYHLKYAHLPPEKRPLRNEILAFHFQSSAELFKDLTFYAISLNKGHFLVSGNVDPSYPQNGYLLKLVDYFSCEVNMRASSGSLIDSDSLVVYKIADSLKKPAAIMGHGVDNAFISEKNLPGLMRSWIAEAYANGHFFMPPYRLWTYTSQKGPGLFFPKDKNEYAPLYAFVKQRKELFDSYESETNVGLVVSYISYRKNQDPIKNIIRTLARMNIPFDVLIAGDEILQQNLSDYNLAKYKTLLVLRDGQLTPEDRNALDTFENEGGKVLYDLSALDSLPKIDVQPENKVRVTLRSSSDQSRPYVAHLLNTDYDLSRDSCDIKKDFTVRIPKKLLRNKEITSVQYVRPNTWGPKLPNIVTREMQSFQDVQLSHSMTGNYFEIKVPYLDIWGILVISTSH